MHDAVQLRVLVLLGLSVANGVSHLTIDHFVHVMHFDAILQHFVRYTVNALRKGHVHANDSDAVVWSHSSLTKHDVVIRVIFLTVPNAPMNCIGGVLYALNLVSNDVF